MCKKDTCKKTASFNFIGLKAKYCGSCKEPNMLNVRHMVCVEDGCKFIPGFNTEGEKKPLYCSIHKLKEMVDVKHKSCLSEGCKIRPIYNVEGQKKPLYCNIHKKNGMIDIINIQCKSDMCKKQPIYNVEGEKKALYCCKHKLEGMVNIKDKTCNHEGCKIRPNYNIEGQKKALYCVEHKLEGMVNIKDKTCNHEGCKIRPNYNNEGYKNPLYCNTHKLEGMVDVRAKRCKSSWCSTQVAEKYDGYCLFCYMNLFPDKPVSHNYKTKEYAVVEYVKTKFPNLQWIADKIVNGGCSKRRPDLLLDLGYQIIIVEIDENQHTEYDCSCENKRIMELSQDLGHRPIVFIRFNPDDYDKNGTNITSCWGHNNKGLCTVKKSKKSEWDQRLTALEEQISYWINPANTTNKTIETVQLFYDV